MLNLAYSLCVGSPSPNGKLRTMKSMPAAGARHVHVEAPPSIHEAAVVSKDAVVPAL